MIVTVTLFENDYGSGLETLNKILANSNLLKLNIRKCNHIRKQGLLWNIYTLFIMS